ncbi:hypothetical protein BDQ17DRAFT_1330888 [Cyathus striatus]|nr:hypothetical protein BDQ17DRAFT_1330888 [Cyathus striatus]
MAVRVDDRDSSISFGKGVWTKHGSSNEYQSTATLTRMQNTYVEFKFNGTSVAVYGTISDSGISITPAISTYQIDSGAISTYSTPIESTVQYQQQFFKASGLKPAEHKLLVTITSENTWFWLDYIEYLPSTVSPIISGASISSNPSSQTQHTTSSDGVTPNSQSTSGGSVDVTTVDGSLRLPVAAIAGGVVGAILLLVATVSMILFSMKRKRKRMDALARESTFWPAPIRTSDVTSFNAADQLSQIHSIPTMLQANGSTPGYSRIETPYTSANSRTALTSNSERHSQDIYTATPWALPSGKFVGQHLNTVQSSKGLDSNSTDNAYQGGFEETPPAYQPPISGPFAYPMEKSLEDHI